MATGNEPVETRSPNERLHENTDNMALAHGYVMSKWTGGRGANWTSGKTFNNCALTKNTDNVALAHDNNFEGMGAERPLRTEFVETISTTEISYEKDTDNNVFILFMIIVSKEGIRLK